MGDAYHDQLLKNGHQTRPDDLEAVARLGIKTIRYPVVWERVAPDHPGQLDWRWTDERLGLLRQKGINPIAGLLHHGSGPRYCTFDQADFPETFARFARQVAERYPWLTLYNPINEPLTTARFAGLYGFWYPHGTDDRMFCRILLNQCKGIVLAMREIRQVNPDAQLIQTEDLGMTHSTGLLRYQAEFENRRRWLGFDLLCGKVGRQHPLWNYLMRSGVEPEELEFFHAHPCPPDMLGMDYYLTSERFLDHDTEKYPPHLIGGNDWHTYVDVETVRVPEAEMAGAESLLTEAWQRYGIPLAITEAHLGCTREEQLRWFYQAYQTGQRLIGKGVNFRAVTAWAMLGSYDWNSLLTRDTGYYEPGLFDVRSPEPRPTALAILVRQLVGQETDLHPVAAESGWWQQGKPPVGSQTVRKPLLVFTDNAPMGRTFALVCEQRGLAYHVVSTDSLKTAGDIHSLVLSLRPWAIIAVCDPVTWTSPMRHPHGAAQPQNLTHLVAVCRHHDLPLLAFSNDSVFDGTKGMPYTESDSVCPPCTPGESRAMAEKLVSDTVARALIVRTGILLNPWHPDALIGANLQNLSHNHPLELPDHRRISPAYLPEVIHHSLDLLLDEAYGIWHLANVGEVSWADFARKMAHQTGGEKTGIEDWYRRQQEKSLGKTTLSTAMSSEKAILMSGLDEAIASYWRLLPQPAACPA